MVRRLDDAGPDLQRRASSFSTSAEARPSLEFFTGYLVEKSLSIDNIFVFLLIFNYFQVPQTYQHKVLFWGIVGAIILRICFIVGGLALMERFHWMIYLFGSFLLLTGFQMMRKKNEEANPEHNWVVQTFRRFFPVSDRYDGNKFFSRIDGKLVATPLFVVLLAVESSDIIFAVDSIPAIFAITQEPFLVYTSNIFAMLGLRALYLCGGGVHADVPLPALRLRLDHPHPRGEDAAERCLQDAGGAVAGSHPRDPAGLRDHLAAAAAPG